MNSKKHYLKIYQQSIQNPEFFWENVARSELDWFKSWDQVYKKDGLNHQWFINAKINITYNCLDRHIIRGQGGKPAYLYFNEQGESASISYHQLLHKVNQVSNFLTSQLRITKGDTVAIYMPLSIEQIIVMLACARIGAIHSVIYAGFSEKALATRIEDAKAKVLFTTDQTIRRGKIINLLSIARKSIQNTSIQNLVIHKRNPNTKLLNSELNFYQAINSQPIQFDPPLHDSQDPLFILYTSGTTGKPKGIVHTTGGYNLYSHYTFKTTFDLEPGDMYWCTADCGWITGHSYIVYGPLSNGVTSVIYEGAPDYPQPGHWWQIISQTKVTKFYTAPTAIRLFMKHGATYPQQYDLSSLKIIGSVGEPLNPEAYTWYYTYIGNSKAKVVDTWWQTETGGHLIVTLPGLPQKPGKAGLPFYGIQAEIVDNSGNPVAPDHKGHLVIKNPWPGALQDCWQDNQRYQHYWTTIKPYFYTGDFAIKDQDNYIQILGRSDDVISVSGHRIGSAEIENILVSHPLVIESAAIGIPNVLTGESIQIFVTLKPNTKTTSALKTELVNYVHQNFGKHAQITKVEFIEQLPKTRSGKIMRRLLKAQALNQPLGDTSTLEN